MTTQAPTPFPSSSSAPAAAPVETPAAAPTPEAAPAMSSSSSSSTTDPAAAPTRSHEAWAKAKGHQVTRERRTRDGKLLATVTTSDWRHAALKAFHKLQPGQVMSEAEYDSKMKALLEEPIGFHKRPSGSVPKADGSTGWAPRQKPFQPTRKAGRPAMRRR